MLCPTQADAEEVVEDLKFFLSDRDVLLLPALGTLPFEPVSPSLETTAKRCKALHHLVESFGKPNAHMPVVITWTEAIIQRTISKKSLISLVFFSKSSNLFKVDTRFV